MENKIGKRLADFKNKGYNASWNTSPRGQCVWYVRGRLYEKLGINLGIYGNANKWFERGKYRGEIPVTNSIACFNNGLYGHVIFIEEVKNGIVYYTESNSNSDNKISSDDGILKKKPIKDFMNLKGYQGVISYRTITTECSNKYYPKCSSKQKSIVDGLKEIGEKSDKDFRKKIAIKNNINNDYKGGYADNIKMLAFLKKGILLKP